MGGREEKDEASAAERAQRDNRSRTASHSVVARGVRSGAVAARRPCATDLSPQCYIASLYTYIYAYIDTYIDIYALYYNTAVVGCFQHSEYSINNKFVKIKRKKKVEPKIHK